MNKGIAYRCESCGFEVYDPIAKLDSSILGLYSDSRFPGRCILVLAQHAEHLEELDSAVLRNLILDLQRAGKVIREVVSAKRMNYAVLGNVAPHLHVHLIPRGGEADANPARTPWEHPRSAEPLTDTEEKRLKEAIAQAIEKNELGRM